MSTPENDDVLRNTITMDEYLSIPKSATDDDSHKDNVNDDEKKIDDEAITQQTNSHPLKSQSDTMSPGGSSVSSCSSRGSSKAGSLGGSAVSAAARRKRERARSSPASLETLNLPSLMQGDDSSSNNHHVRSDSMDAHSSNQRQRQQEKISIVDDLVHVLSDEGAEMEVHLRHIDSGKVLQKRLHHQNSSTTTTANSSKYSLEGEEEEKKSETSVTPRSPLEIRAMEIMQNAKLSSLELGGAAPTEDSRSKLLIQEALDRAAARSKAAAAEALHDGSAIIQTSDSTSAAAVQQQHPASPPAIQQQQQPASPPDPVMNSRIHPQFRSREAVQDMARNNTATLGTLKAPDPPSVLTTPNPYGEIDAATKLERACLSPTDSICSIDDFDNAVNRLPSRYAASGNFPRDKMLRRLDGAVTPPILSPAASPRIDQTVAGSCRSPPPCLSTHFEEDESSLLSNNSDKITKSVSYIKPVVIKSFDEEQAKSSGGWFDYFWGTTQEETDKKDEPGDSMMAMNCGSSRSFVKEELPTVSKSLVHVMTDPVLPSYAEALEDQQIDIRMPEWIDSQFYTREDLPQDGTYQLGESRTVIVHEIIRGSWTWATAWSPDGKNLAVGTDNHHLAVIDTTSSSVWRVRHDKKVTGPAKPGTTHSIRSVAWGNDFIAIGGTGNAVSILSPAEPYQVLHTISPTGFVGSLHWLPGSNTLLIGSRLGTAIVAKIRKDDQPSEDHSEHVQSVQSTIVHSIDRGRAWVNAVKFSPGGTALALGDSTGILGVYQYDDQSMAPLANVANFKLEDSILDLEWSPDGKWLYAGGEDFAVTVISTQSWEAVHRVKRDRWVHFMSSSHGGTHVAVGGVSSEVSILDVNRGWDPAINVSLKGLVPLSAQWHPHDQYLVLTGQNNSILAVETTNARYVSGHFLRSASPILSIEFSPDGRMAAIGNEAGIVTIFKLSGTTFISVYEMVLDCDSFLSIRWSMNGAFLAISVENKVVIVSGTKKTQSAPPDASGFSVSRVIRNLGKLHDVAIDPTSRFVAVSGRKTRILDSTIDFKCVMEIENEGLTIANAFSPDGKWFATCGRNQNLVVYDTSPTNLSDWSAALTVQTPTPALALTWSPTIVGGLHYLAYGGEDKAVHIMEIRTKERTWETVINIQREDIVFDLDWSSNGLVAAGIGNGTVSVFDLSYLQSGWAVNEMDYNWQRQALTCVTEIRRNRGKQSMRCVSWIPSAPGSDTLLAVGGTDGEVEIVDLTERQRCSGFFQQEAPQI